MKCKSKLKLKLNYADLCSRQRYLPFSFPSSVPRYFQLSQAKPSQTGSEISFRLCRNSRQSLRRFHQSKFEYARRVSRPMQLSLVLVAVGLFTATQPFSHSAIQLCKLFLFENNNNSNKTPRHSIEPRIRMQIRIP